jgi:hypothetical protein
LQEKKAEEPWQVFWDEVWPEMNLTWQMTDGYDG